MGMGIRAWLNPTQQCSKQGWRCCLSATGWDQDMGIKNTTTSWVMVSCWPRKAWTQCSLESAFNSSILRPLKEGPCGGEGAIDRVQSLGKIWLNKQMCP